MRSFNKLYNLHQENEMISDMEDTTTIYGGTLTFSDIISMISSNMPRSRHDTSHDDSETISSDSSLMSFDFDATTEQNDANDILNSADNIISESDNKQSENDIVPSRLDPSKTKKPKLTVSRLNLSKSDNLSGKFKIYSPITESNGDYHVLSDFFAGIPMNHKTAKISPHRMFIVGAIGSFKLISYNRISKLSSYLEETRIITSVSPITNNITSDLTMTICPVVSVVGGIANYINDQITITGNIYRNTIANTNIISHKSLDIEKCSFTLINKPANRTQSINGLLIEYEGTCCQDVVTDRISAKFSTLIQQLQIEISEDL